jgi:FAD:protein FMN transferase
VNASVLPTYELVTTAMSTTVSVQIIGDHPNAAVLAADALGWFTVVEQTATRFDVHSELMQLCAAGAATTVVSPLLFELLRLALSVADVSRGAFDPTAGAQVHQLGFDRPWRGGPALPAPVAAHDVSFRDVDLEESTSRVHLRRPLLLDLGAIAKGFAIDLAARALAAVAHGCVNAGGDLWYRGRNAKGEPWRTGIVHPRDERNRLATVQVHAGEFAICTSGDYARRTTRGHHLVDPRAHGGAATLCQSVTVVAPQAAIADALATAAFVLGPREGATLLAAQGVDGCLVDASGNVHMVHGWGMSEWDLAAR